MTKLDHIVVGCADLKFGVTWMTDMLGVGPSGGGEHDLMGTHNALWRLGDAYLEVIAINPDAGWNTRKRWFG